jgi:hypothetical protein
MRSLGHWDLIRNWESELFTSQNRPLELESEPSPFAPAMKRRISRDEYSQADAGQQERGGQGEV